jgi:AAA domain
MTECQDDNRTNVHEGYISPCIKFEQIAKSCKNEIANSKSTEPDELCSFVDEDIMEVDPIISGAFDSGDKLSIIGPSKIGKSFFALQLGMCVASGQEKFMAWDIPKRRRVLLVQFENKREHYLKRAFRMTKSMNIPFSDLVDDQGSSTLTIWSLRGVGITWEQIRERAAGYDLLIIDPWYKFLSRLFDTDETSARGVTDALVAIEELIAESEISIVIIHHDTKGRPSYMANADRGSGTGVLARDGDARFTLTQHKSEDGAVVVETLFREYQTSQPITAAFKGSHFVHDPSLAPQKETNASASQKNRSTPASDVDGWILKNLVEVTKTSDFKMEVQKKAGVGSSKASDAIKRLADNRKIDRWKGERNRSFVGPAGTKPPEFEAF